MINPITKQIPAAESHPKSALCKGNFFTSEDARGILIFILQITSWIGYINLLDIEKRYKLWLSVLSVCAVFIIGFFYILK